MTSDLVQKVHALGLGLSEYRSGLLLVTAYSDEDAAALVGLGFRAGPREQRFPGRSEPGVLIECTYSPPTEDGEPVTDSPGSDAVGTT